QPLNTAYFELVGTDNVRVIFRRAVSLSFCFRITTPPELHCVVEHRGDGGRVFPCIARALERGPLRSQARLVELSRILPRPVAPDQKAAIAPTEPLDRSANLHPGAVAVAELLGEYLLVSRNSAQRRAQPRLFGKAPRRVAVRRRISLRLGIFLGRGV